MVVFRNTWITLDEYWMIAFMSIDESSLRWRRERTMSVDEWIVDVGTKLLILVSTALDKYKYSMNRICVDAICLPFRRMSISIG